MPRVIHFEINADQPERAVDFYTKVFGWKTNKWEGPMEYWLITTGEKDEPGINGGLTRRHTPGASTVNTVNVPSVDEYVAKITKAGGQVVVPKMAIPGVGYLVYCLDTEGNTFGIMQADTAAK